VLSKVSVVIPCLNTERTIGSTVLLAKQYSDRVLVVNDGSRDNTRSVAEMAGAFILDNGSNKGYGASILAGLEEVQYISDVVVTLDGDGQHDPKGIPSLILPILEGIADVVIGSRLLKNQSSIPFYRRIGIRIITFAYNLGAKSRLTDAQSGLRAYSGKAFLLLLEESKELGSGMDFSVYSLILLRKSGLRFFEVPVSCSYIKDSTYNAIVHGLFVAIATLWGRIRR